MYPGHLKDYFLKTLESKLVPEVKLSSGFACKIKEVENLTQICFVLLHETAKLR